jgi:hypothetical protein
MSTEGNSVAAGYALDCIAKAEHATRGLPPDPALELAKAQVYAVLAVAEALEDSDGPVFTRD